MNTLIKTFLPSVLKRKNLHKKVNSGRNGRLMKYQRKTCDVEYFTRISHTQFSPNVTQIIG